MNFPGSVSRGRSAFTISSKRAKSPLANFNFFFAQSTPISEVVRYRVFLSGQNLLAEVEGSLQYLGFYTTRIVAASTEAEAESLALDLIRRDKKLLQMMRNEADDPPTFAIEEIVEIADESEARNTGFAFYPDTTI